MPPIGPFSTNALADLSLALKRKKVHSNNALWGELGLNQESEAKLSLLSTELKKVNQRDRQVILLNTPLENVEPAKVVETLAKVVGIPVILEAYSEGSGILQNESYFIGPVFSHAQTFANTQGRAILYIDNFEAFENYLKESPATEATFSNRMVKAMEGNLIVMLGHSGSKPLDERRFNSIFKNRLLTTQTVDLT